MEKTQKKANVKTKTWVEYKIAFLPSNADGYMPHEDTIPAKSDAEARRMFKAWKELHKNSEFRILKCLKKTTVITELA